LPQDGCAGIIEGMTLTHRWSRWPWLALVLGALLLGACRQEAAESPYSPIEREREGDPRSYLLGFSDVPPELTDEAYVRQFDFAAAYGEAILLQRPPAWADFLPGASVSDALRDEVLAAREAARARDLAVVVALDPFDPANRARLDALPPGYEGRSLADPDLLTAFTAEAEFIARNMRPDFLVLGSEINATYERNPEAYFAFLEAYRAAYDVVKRASPQTQVLVTFQYEELLGVVPELPPHAPRWELLDDLGLRLDLLGLTSYPSFAYPTARKVPPEYYLQLVEHTDRPVAFVGVGFSSGAHRSGVNASTEPEQRRFLQRLLEDALALQSPLLVWFAAHDLGFADTAPYDLLSSIGLRTADGEAKEAWSVWEEASRRPVDAEAAAALLAERDQEAEAERTAEEAAQTPTPAPTPADDDSEDDPDSEGDPDPEGDPHSEADDGEAGTGDGA